MVAMYTIAGRQVGSHVLSMATLGSTFAIAAYFMSGKPAEKAQGPPINAGSKDEEKFIQDFLKNAEGGEGKSTVAKH